MEYETLRYEQDGHVVTLTYDRPDQHNAVNRAMNAELHHAWQRFRDDDSAFVLVITGAGVTTFCAGWDLQDAAELEELGRLSTGARAAASKSGAPADGATFRPHLTLARMRRPVEATRWLRVLSTYRSRAFEVTEFALVQSHLGQGPGNRPRYDVVQSFELGKEGRDPSHETSA